jgi:hypothetical protein
MNKLSSFKGSCPGIPYHRIILKDPDKSINDRIFQLPERFLNHLAEFLQEYIDAGRIYPSSSNMTAGTWMIPKPKDLIVISRMIYDYRILNENTIKDHIPLPHQDQILRRLYQIFILRFLDYPTVFYQIYMEEDSIRMTIFKISFDIFEWLIIS